MSHRDEKSIFLSALDKHSPAERAAFLAAACGDDAALRSEIEQLLDAHERPQHPLDRIPAGVDAVREHFANEPAPAAASAAVFHDRGPETVDDQPIREAAGSVIGPYTLREQVGEGGF